MKSYYKSEIYAGGANKKLDMVSQHQLYRVRIKIVLLFQIGFIEFSDIMVDQYNRDDKRDIAFMIRIKYI